MTYLLMFLGATLGSIIYQFYCETRTLRKFKVSSQESFERVLNLVIESFPSKLLTALICAVFVTLIAMIFEKIFTWFG